MFSAPANAFIGGYKLRSPGYLPNSSAKLRLYQHYPPLKAGTAIAATPTDYITYTGHSSSPTFETWREAGGKLLEVHMLQSVKNLIGYDLKPRDGEIGSVKDLLFDDALWVARYLVVDKNKWLPGSRKLLISPVSLMPPNITEKQFPVNLTREQVENSPQLEEHEPVSRQYERQLFHYYGYAYYWMGPGLWGTYPRPTPLADTSTGSEDVDNFITEPHLRSVDEIIGYQMQTDDKCFGQVKDFIINDDDWSLSFVVVNTHDWLPGGRNLLIGVDKITDINWDKKRIHIPQQSDVTLSNPEFDPDAFDPPIFEDKKQLIDQIKTETQEAS